MAIKMPNQDIGQRYATRAQAEGYRDRFKKGRRRRTHEREAAALQSLLDSLGRLDIVLDVGSGPGRFATLFAAHVGRLIQADFSNDMLEVSRDHYPLEASRSGYAQADVRHLPFATGSVDLVFCHRLLNHLPNPEDRRHAFAELARVTRRYVVVSCLSAPAPLRLLRRAYVRLKGGDPTRSFVDVGDVFRDANETGLRLAGRTPIRTFGRSAAFFTFVNR